MMKIALALIAAVAHGSGYGARMCLNSTGPAYNATAMTYYPSSMSLRQRSTAAAEGWTSDMYTYPNSTSGLNVDIYMLQIASNLVSNADASYVGFALQVQTLNLVSITDNVDILTTGLCRPNINKTTAVVGSDNPDSNIYSLPCADFQWSHQESSAKPYSTLLFPIVTAPGTPVNQALVQFLVLDGVPKATNNDTNAGKAAQTFVSGTVRFDSAQAPTPAILTRFFNEQCTQYPLPCPQFNAQWLAVCSQVEALLPSGSGSDSGSSDPSPAFALMASFAAVIFALLF